MPQGKALWFTGLPGSGKSTVARKTLELLEAKGIKALHLQMDERRKAYFPNPTYTKEERAQAYTLFAEEARDLAAQGNIVLMDGTAYKKSMRDYARQIIPDFSEVYLRCSLDTAMNRERNRPEGLVMADLYEKALERKRTGKEFEGLGPVIGVDVEFEEDPLAELVLDVEDIGPDIAARETAQYAAGDPAA